MNIYFRIIGVEIIPLNELKVLQSHFLEDLKIVLFSISLRRLIKSKFAWVTGRKYTYILYLWSVISYQQALYHALRYLLLFSQSESGFLLVLKTKICMCSQTIWYIDVIKWHVKGKKNKHFVGIDVFCDFLPIAWFPRSGCNVSHTLIKKIGLSST